MGLTAYGEPVYEEVARLVPAGRRKFASARYFSHLASVAVASEDGAPNRTPVASSNCSGQRRRRTS